MTLSASIPLSTDAIIVRTNVQVHAIIRGRASTASVATLAKNGVGRSGFTCRAASKSGEYPHQKTAAEPESPTPALRLLL